MVARHSIAQPWQPPPNDSAGPMNEMKFTAEQLPAVRRFAEIHARRYEVDDALIGDLVIAVNEIATNAVRHGSPHAELRMWTEKGRVIAEIRDSGSWALPTDPGGSPPAPEAEGGMGIWVARQICSAVHIRTGINGTVVRLELSPTARYI
jgi:serine/threonine-protein kinase RsbW